MMFLLPAERVGILSDGGRFLFFEASVFSIC